MIKNGLDRVLISVQSMEESLAFYGDLLKMTVVADDPLPSQAVCQLWRLPEGTKARSVLLRMEEQLTLLELIEFQPHSGQFIRSKAKTYDYGLFDVAFRAKRPIPAPADSTPRMTSIWSGLVTSPTTGTPCESAW